MKAVIVMLLLAAGAAGRGDLIACGEKFLVVGRGTRFQRAPIPPASAAILVYADTASNLPRALTKLDLDAALRKAGYHPTSVDSPGALARAFDTGKWDLVLVDAAAVESVRTLLRGVAAPALLPVFYNPTSAEWKQAAKQYPVALRAPAKNQVFLDAVEEALASRSQHPARDTGKSTS